MYLRLGFYIKGKRQEKSLTRCLRESVQGTNNGYITAKQSSGSKWVLFNTDHCVYDLYFRAILRLLMMADLGLLLQCCVHAREEITKRKCATYGINVTIRLCASLDNHGNIGILSFFTDVCVVTCLSNDSQSLNSGRIKYKYKLHHTNSRHTHRIIQNSWIFMGRPTLQKNKRVITHD